MQALGQRRHGLPVARAKLVFALHAGAALQ
jgi:hypothetical protein